MFQAWQRVSAGISGSCRWSCRIPCARQQLFFSEFMHRRTNARHNVDAKIKGFIDLNLLLSNELLDNLDDLSMTDTIKSAERSSTSVGRQRLDGFHNLVQELSGYLDTAQSLAFSEICDPNAVIHRMREYQSDRSEWAKYAHEDENYCFTRNMVERGLGKSNIVRSHLG